MTQLDALTLSSQPRIAHLGETNCENPPVRTSQQRKPPQHLQRQALQDDGHEAPAEDVETREGPTRHEPMYQQGARDALLRTSCAETQALLLGQPQAGSASHSEAETQEQATAENTETHLDECRGRASQPRCNPHNHSVRLRLTALPPCEHGLSRTPSR